MIWEKLSSPWKAAFAQAWEGYCHGSLPIGAAVADPVGNVISVGRSRRTEQSGPEKHVFGNRLAHAELNALLTLDYSLPVDLHQCVVYTTTEPCPLCCGAIVMANVRHVAFASRDPWAGGAAELYQSTAYLRRKQMRVTGPQDGSFETILMALHCEYFLRELGYGNKLMPVFQAVDPIAVYLSENWFENGFLAKLAEKGWEAEPVLDALERELEAAVERAR